MVIYFTEKIIILIMYFINKIIIFINFDLIFS